MNLDTHQAAEQSIHHIIMKDVEQFFYKTADVYTKRNELRTRAEDEYQQAEEVLNHTQQQFTEFLHASLSITHGQYASTHATDSYKPSSIPQFHFAAFKRVADYLNEIGRMKWETEQYNNKTEFLMQQDKQLNQTLYVLKKAISLLPAHLSRQITWLYATNQQGSNIYHILHNLLSDSRYQLTDDAICRLAGEQIVPIPPLVEFIRQRITTQNYRSHKLLDHLHALTASVISPAHDTLFQAVLEVTQLIIDAPHAVTDQYIAKLDNAITNLPNTQGDWPAETQVEAHIITWPFQRVENKYVADPTKTLLNQRPVFADNRLSMTYSFAPDRALASAGLPAEDMLWFDATDANHFCAIVADGASQSALGSVAARTICDNLSRLYLHHLIHLDTIPTKPDIEHTFAIAKWDGNALLDQEIKSVPTYIRESIERKRDEFGSQAVVSMVVRHANQLLITWVGNVRVIVPGIIDAQSARFDSDWARFTSNVGLLGDLSYVIRLVPATNTLQVMMLSDALERYKLILEKQAMSDEQLLECAKSDDTTLVDIRVAPIH